MVKADNLRKFLGHRFSSGSVTGDDFKSFVTKFRNYMKKVCETNKFTMLSFNKGHYECSGFIKNENGQIIYWSISDVRYWQDEWFNSVLYRIAEHEKDYKGLTNHYSSLETLDDNIKKLTSKEVYIGKKLFTHDKMLEIGNELASIWGGSCFNFTIDYDEKVVYFECIEHGERFSTSQTFEEF